MLADILPLYDNLIILGDLNLHWNDTENPIISTLEDSLTAAGLKQHVREYTHKEDNILDIIITSNDVKYEYICEVKDSFQTIAISFLKLLDKRRKSSIRREPIDRLKTYQFPSGKRS